MIAELSLRARLEEARRAVTAATADLDTAQLLVQRDPGPGQGGPDAGELWDLPRVLELLERADTLEWTHPGMELLVKHRGDYDRRVVLLAWEVDNAAGDRVYLGVDLALAEQLYESEPGGHLIPLRAGVPA